MELTLSMHDGLPEFFALLHHPCRVFLAHLQQCSHHLLGILRVVGFDGTAILRVRILDEVKTLFGTLTIERVARLHIFQLHGTADVTGVELIHGDAVGTGTDIDLSHTLLGSTVSIEEIIARLDTSTHHLEVRHLADMRFHAALEEVEALGTIAVGCHLFATCVAHLRHLADKRHHIAKEFHQSLYTHILMSVDAEHGEDAACDESLTDPLSHLVLGQRLSVEELLHKLVVILGSSLDKSFVQFHGLIHFLSRNLLTLGLTAIGSPREFLHDEYIDQAVEVWTRLQWILDLHTLAAVDVLHLLDDVVIVALV